MYINIYLKYLKKNFENTLLSVSLLENMSHRQRRRSNVSVYVDAFCIANLTYISHHCPLFTLLYFGEMKNVNRELKMHTEIAHEVCYLGKKLKSFLDKGL
jgi:hypothetical protein